MTDLDQQSEDIGYWQHVIDVAENDIAEALIKIEQLRDTKQDIPEEPF